MFFIVWDGYKDGGGGVPGRGVQGGPGVPGGRGGPGDVRGQLQAGDPPRGLQQPSLPGQVRPGAVSLVVIPCLKLFLLDTLAVYKNCRCFKLLYIYLYD